MIESRGEPDLANEPLPCKRLGQLGAEHLDRDVTLVFEIMREIDSSHAALPELTLDAIAVREGGAETFGVSRQHVHEVGRADRGIALRAPRGDGPVSREPN